MEVRGKCEFSQSVMTWGCISVTSARKICFLKRLVNAAVNPDIHIISVSHTLRTSLGTMNLSFNMTLLHPRTAKSIKEWFREKRLTVLDWPANSSDVNPIENF